jgi:hypothetical protein
MAEQTKRGRSQDRAKVAGGQEHETPYEVRRQVPQQDRFAPRSNRSATLEPR